MRTLLNSIEPYDSFFDELIFEGELTFVDVYMKDLCPYRMLEIYDAYGLVRLTYDNKVLLTKEFAEILPILEKVCYKTADIDNFIAFLYLYINYEDAFNGNAGADKSIYPLIEAGLFTQHNSSLQMTPECIKLKEFVDVCKNS